MRPDLINPLRWALVSMALIGSTILLAGSHEASAFGRHDYGLAPGQRFVVVESNHGNGRISAPVRYTVKGPQIRLPGGNWIYCEHRCSETLRLATVDFWESKHADHDNGEGGCGLLTCRLNLKLNF